MERNSVVKVVGVLSKVLVRKSFIEKILFYWRFEGDEGVIYVDI